VRRLLPLAVPLVLLLPACSGGGEPDPCRAVDAAAEQQAAIVNQARDDKEAAGQTPQRAELEAQQDAATRRLAELIVAEPACFSDPQVQRSKELLEKQ
jgi:hypothetical protein